MPMTATLPTDPYTERLAREVARVTGKPLQTVLRDAIAAAANAVGVWPLPRRSVDMDRVRAILARVDALPVLDRRTADEIIGYDKLGLPR
jgi:antitoxin VapB